MRGPWEKIGILPCLIWAVKDFVHYQFILVGVGVLSVVWSTKKVIGASEAYNQRRRDS
jgi:hypothetical protein